MLLLNKYRAHLTTTTDDFSVGNKLPLSVLLFQYTDFDTSAHEVTLPSLNPLTRPHYGCPISMSCKGSTVRTVGAGNYSFFQKRNAIRFCSDSCLLLNVKNSLQGRVYLCFCRKHKIAHCSIHYGSCKILPSFGF